jgi:hydroxyethylthiazole kinase-like sugar kinase family protein
MQGTDYLGADHFSALGGTPILVVDAAEWQRPASPLQAVIVGIDREGSLPSVRDQDFDLLLTSCDAAPRPWVSLDPSQFDETIQRLADSVNANPVAAPHRNWSAGGRSPDL